MRKADHLGGKIYKKKFYRYGEKLCFLSKFLVISKDEIYILPSIIMNDSSSYQMSHFPSSKRYNDNGSDKLAYTLSSFRKFIS